MSGLSHLLEQAESLAEVGHPILNRNLGQIKNSTYALRNKSAQEITTQSRDDGAALAKIDLTETQRLVESITRKKPLRQATPSIQPTDVEGFIRNQYQNTIITAIEDTKILTSKYFQSKFRESLDHEWEESKREILEELGYHAVTFVPSGESFSQEIATQPSVLNTMKEYQSVIAALNQSRRDKKPYPLVEQLTKVSARPGLARDARTNEFSDCWKILEYMLRPYANSPEGHLETLLSTPEGSQTLQRVFIRQAKKFLEEQYFRVVEQYVSKSGMFRTGDINPLKAIQLFVKRKLERTPVDLNWTTIYYCIRCGKLEEALQLASSLQSEPQFYYLLQTYVQCERSENPDYSRLNRDKIRDNYRTRTEDIHHNQGLQALYMILGQIKPISDMKTIIPTTQDFMWLQLAAIRDEDSDPEYTLEALQNSLVQWGPAHFNPKGTNPLLYFQVLLLSQQFSQAIQYLDSHVQYKVEAVHFGCALYYFGLLPRTVITKQPTFNFQKMLAFYVRQFAVTNPVESVQYYFLLREKESQIAYITQHICQTQQLSLLGVAGPEGSLHQGEIYYLPEDVVTEIITRVATDFKKKDNFEEAIALFNMAKKYEQVLEIINSKLGAVLTSPGLERTRLRDIARFVSLEYSKGGRDSVLQSIKSSKQLKTFDQLLKLLQFFELYESSPPDLQQALMTQQELGLIPLKSDELKVKVEQFSGLEETVKQNFGEVLYTVMHIYSQWYNEYARQARGANFNQSAEPIIEELRSRARCLVNFMGQIPYRISDSISQKLIQMQVKMG